MIERWIETGKKNCLVWHQMLCQRTAVIPAGLWIMALAVLLAGIHPLGGHFSKRTDLDVIADESGSISYMFYRNGVPFGYRDAFGTHADSPHINGEGSRIAYCLTSENGGGAFVADLITGEKRLAFEEMATNFYNGPSTVLSVHAWSPDNARFIYSRIGCGLNIFDAASGKTTAAVQGLSPDGLVWLTTNSFALVSRYSTNTYLHLLQEQADGKWKETIKPIKAGFMGLTALSKDKVAWLDNDRILALDIVSGKTELVTALSNHKFMEFDYSPQTGGYLFISTTNSPTGRNNFLWQLDAGSQTPNLMASTPALRNARWINHGKGHAYVDQNDRLEIWEDTNAASVRLFEQGRADSFDVSANGLHLAVTGIASNEPSFGLWEYNLTAHNLQLVVPGAEHGLAHLKPVIPQIINLPGPANRNLRLVIFKPVNFDRHKQFPVVIANTPFTAAQPYMKQYALAVANAGGYFVVMDRLDWFNKNGFEAAWSENEACIINCFDQDPTIDCKRIYLVSNCIESNFLKEFAAKHPGEASRAIMLIANSLPDPANFTAGASAPKLLISTCDTWEGKGERMQKYQQTAAQSGVEVVYLIHRNTKHDFVSKESQRDRIGAMLHFIFDP